MADMGAYEFDLPADFDIQKFIMDTSKAQNGLWLVPISNDGLYRFRGVFIPSYDRVVVDVGEGFAFVNAPECQNTTKKEAVIKVMECMHGSNLSKDGKEEDVNHD